MRPRHIAFIAAGTLSAVVGVFALTEAWAARSKAQVPTALTGKISSAEEGLMEGVLVSAKKLGSTITITVVSDKDGHYSFPSGKLSPGEYALRIRAVGYDLDNSKSVKIAAKRTTTYDIK